MRISLPPALKSLERPLWVAHKMVRRVISKWRQLEGRIQQRRFVGTYIAVTGSCGKTTTTALLGGLLAKVGSTRVALTRNHDTALLRTVRRLKAPVDFVVQEAGAHRPGTLAVVTGAFRIDVAVVTAVGHDHATNYRYEGTDVPTAIAREKGRIVEHTRAGGLVCLNADDPLVRAMAARTRARVVTFGRSEDAELRAVNVDGRWPGRLSFDLVVAGRTRHVATRFVGTLMLTNILAALAVIHGLGHDLDQAIKTIAELEPLHDRMGVHQGKDGKTYVLDTEKAPHWSTLMLLDDLANLGTRELTFVLGDISDIRNSSGRKYRQVLRSLCERVDRVIATGRSAEYVERLNKEGVANLVAAPAAIDVARYLDTQPPGLIILKSSAATQLWRVLDQVTPVAGSADVES